jgi:hypothetical protein
MSTDVAETEPGLPPAANAYLVLGLAGIVVIGVALLQCGVDRWAVVPTLVGAAGLVFRWRSSAPVLLAAVAFILAAPYASWRPPRMNPPLPATLALCAAVLTYVVAQYRLLSLTVAVFPPEAKRRPEKPPPRPADAVSVREAPAALLAVAAAAVGALFLWELTGRVPPQWNVEPRRWHVGLLVWVVAAGLVVVAGVVEHLGWRRQSPAEAELFLRDVLWAETRGEQRRVNRWRAWALRRRERRGN